MATVPSERVTPRQFADQRMLLIGVGLTICAILLFLWRRQAPEEQAARRMVRDLRRVDDVDAARDLLGSNVPVVMRPVLLMILEEIERQVDHAFRRLERAIEQL